MMWIVIIVVAVCIVAAAIIGGMGFGSSVQSDNHHDRQGRGGGDSFIDWMI